MIKQRIIRNTCLSGVLLLLIAGSVQAADVTLTATDLAGTTSFNLAGNWDNASAPSSGNDYFTSSFMLRTPTVGGAIFAGDSLSLDTGGTLEVMTTTPSVVSNLIARGGVISPGKDNAQLSGAINLVSNLTVNVTGLNAWNNIIINSDISGTGKLTCSLDNHGRSVALAGSNTFSGGLTVNPGYNTYVGVWNENALGSGPVNIGSQIHVRFNLATDTTITNDIWSNYGNQGVATRFAHNLNSGRITLTGALYGDSSSGTPISFNGAANNGGFVLAGDNDFRDEFYLMGSTTIWAAHNNALDCTSEKICYYQGGTLYLMDGITISEPIRDARDGWTNYTGYAFTIGTDQTNATCTFASTIDLRKFNNPTNINTWVFESGPGSTVTFSGDISHSFTTNQLGESVLNPVVKTGEGTVVFSGSNTFTSPMIVSNGTLRIDGDLDLTGRSLTIDTAAPSGGLLEVTGNLTLGGDLTVLNARSSVIATAGGSITGDFDTVTIPSRFGVLKVGNQILVGPKGTAIMVR